MSEIGWAAIAAHRDRLLRIARRRCATREDAEDVVQDALLRAATFGGLDPDRLGAFLTSVTVRLCADLYRDSQRSQRAAARLDLGEVPEPESSAMAAAEAVLIGDALTALPPTQRAVLVDRADGMTVPQICRRHSLTYKAAESALSRARSAMRLALASVLSAIGAAVATFRRRPAAVLAVPVVTIALYGAVAHVPWHQDQLLPGPPLPAPIVAAPQRMPYVTTVPAARTTTVTTRRSYDSASAALEHAPLPASRHTRTVPIPDTGTAITDDGEPGVSSPEYWTDCVDDGAPVAVTVGMQGRQVSSNVSCRRRTN